MPEGAAIRGGCLCGGARFEIRGQPTPIQVCHARRCRKATGSAFAPEIGVRAEDFRWLHGRELAAVYEAPLLREPPRYKRAFCRVCGAPLPVVTPGAPWVVLLAGTLDDDPGTRPFRHVFTGQGAPWHDIRDELPAFEEHVPSDQRLPGK